MQEGRLTDLPLVGGKEEDVCAGRIHLVTLPRMNRLLLDGLDLQCIHLHVEDLADVHNDRLVDLLPKMGAENLNQRNLQGRYLTVHENSCQVELDLETNIDVGPVDRRGPPKRETSVWNLIETRSLGMGQLLVLHGLLEARCFLPEESLPGGEVSSLEEGVFQNTFDTTEGLNHVRPVIVQIPQFAIVLLMGPPEWVLLQDLVLFEVLADAPAFVVG